MDMLGVVGIVYGALYILLWIITIALKNKMRH